jgi:predicted dehydrogenase
VIGLGARAETFARSLYAGTPRAELFALCDLDEDRIAKFVKYCELTNARTFSDPTAFFACPEMDAVIITTPDFTHLDVARQAFAAGKHVYLEKPLDVTAERCREIMRLQQRSGKVAYVGFNLRAAATRIKMKELLQQQVLGQILHIEGLEQLSVAHSASFMRRFHRRTARSGGLLNTKCSHDLDILQWLIGHEHKVVKLASFGGNNVFTSRPAPATHCHKCPADIYRACPYKDQAGFVFPVHAKEPIHHRQTDVYGGDLCVYNDDKDIVDNQTLILEWDHGVRGNFNLQLFQHQGTREMKIWGERGLMTNGIDAGVKVVNSATGDATVYHFAPRGGGHGGTDPQMIGRFLDAIECGDAGDSGLAAGLAATLLAEKSIESMRTGQVVTIAPAEYAP